VRPEQISRNGAGHEVCLHFGELELCILELEYRLAEDLAVLDVVEGQVERQLGRGGRASRSSAIHMKVPLSTDLSACPSAPSMQSAGTRRREALADTRRSHAEYPCVAT
jgi:hypothetical protein